MSLGHRVFAATALLAVCIAPSVQAVPISAEASDNATVQVAGPRSGTSGKAFFNVEGSANGNFASYGVADFDFGAQPYPVIGINSIALALTQSNAAFSFGGDVVLSLDKSAVLADIQPGGSSPLNFDGADPGTATDVGEGDLDLLSLGGGPFTYFIGANGDVDLFAIVLNPISAAEIMSRLNSVSPIRIVVGTGANNVAATWAGATNSTYDGPTLILDVEYDTSVPAEPSTWGKVKAAYR